jgi:hypothetical protein
VAELTAAQSEALVQRQSQDDLKSLILAFQRDGSVSGEFADPLEGIEDGDEKAAAEEARDEELANSVLFSEVASNAPTEEELAGNAEAAEAAGEVEEEAAAPKASKQKASASAEGA